MVGPQYPNRTLIKKVQHRRLNDYRLRSDDLSQFSNNFLAFDPTLHYPTIADNQNARTLPAEGSPGGPISAFEITPMPKVSFPASREFDFLSLVFRLVFESDRRQFAIYSRRIALVTNMVADSEKFMRTFPAYFLRIDPSFSRAGAAIVSTLIVLSSGM
jgi:hypothetical protein